MFVMGRLVNIGFFCCKIVVDRFYSHFAKFNGFPRHQLKLVYGWDGNPLNPAKSTNDTVEIPKIHKLKFM